MSKKAKQLKASHKRSKTILGALKMERDGYAARFEKASDRVAELEAEVRKVTAQQDETFQRSLDRAKTIESMRGTINDLKLIIADLEARCAEQRGTIMTLERQIDQAAPKVMVKPPQMLSPREAEQFNSPGLYAGRGVDMAGLEREMRSTPKKHWTAL